MTDSTQQEAPTAFSESAHSPERQPTVSALARTPTVWITAGVALGIIALFLPWWGFSGPEGTVLSPSNGFSGWGTLYFVCWFLVGGFIFLRTVGREAVRDLALPFADWLAYFLGGILMSISVLAVWASIPSSEEGIPFSTAGISAGTRPGWWVALMAAVLVLVGAAIERSRQPTI